MQKLHFARYLMDKNNPLESGVTTSISADDLKINR